MYLSSRCQSFRQHISSTVPYGTPYFDPTRSLAFQYRGQSAARHVFSLPPNLELKCFTRLHASHHLEETAPLQTIRNNTSNEQQSKPTSTTHITRKKRKHNHVRSNPPHHRPLPRAILPPDRPHPRQSAPAPWRASDDRRRWAGQRILEPRKFVMNNSPTKSLKLIDFTGLTPPTQPRGRNHRQSAKRPQRAGDGQHGSGT